MDSLQSSITKCFVLFYYHILKHFNTLSYKILSLYKDIGGHTVHHAEHQQIHVASVFGVSAPSEVEVPSDSVPSLPKLAWRSTEPELTPSRCAWACKQRAFSMSCMRMKRPWVWRKNIPGKKGTLLEQVVIFCYSGAPAYEPQLSQPVVFSGKIKDIN